MYRISVNKIWVEISSACNGTKYAVDKRVKKNKN